MDSNVIASRPSSIADSIINSMHEVTLMRTGEMEKPTLDALFANIEIWVSEDNNDVQNNPNTAISKGC